MSPPGKLGPELCGVLSEIGRVLAKNLLEYRSMLGFRRTPMFRGPELQRRDNPVIDAAYREPPHNASKEPKKWRPQWRQYET
jgi:hypothetical protein